MVSVAGKTARLLEFASLSLCRPTNDIHGEDDGISWESEWLIGVALKWVGADNGERARSIRSNPLRFFFFVYVVCCFYLFVRFYSPPSSERPPLPKITQSQP